MNSEEISSSRVAVVSFLHLSARSVGFFLIFISSMLCLLLFGWLRMSACAHVFSGPGGNSLLPLSVSTTIHSLLFSRSLKKLLLEFITSHVDHGPCVAECYNYVSLSNLVLSWSTTDSHSTSVWNSEEFKWIWLSWVVLLKTTYLNSWNTFFGERERERGTQ